MKRKVIAVIAASMASNRFPGQPLAKILALPIIEHVRRRVIISRLTDEIFVQTADAPIQEAVENYGGKVLAVAPTVNIFERLKQAAAQAGLSDQDIVISLSTYEPLFSLDVLKALADPLLADPSLGCANVLCTITDEAELQDKESIKAVLNVQSKVMYYSHAPIPFRRIKNYSQAFRKTSFAAMTKAFIDSCAAMAPSPLEITEGVDLMRPIEYGHGIQGVMYHHKIAQIISKEQIGTLEGLMRKDFDQSQIYQAILNL